MVDTTALLQFGLSIPASLEDIKHQDYQRYKKCKGRNFQSLSVNVGLK
jgi:hypothetical protein